MSGWRLHVAAAATAGVLGLSLWALFDAITPPLQKAPVRFSGVEVLTPVVEPGQPVQVRIHRTKERDDCGRVLSNRRALDLDANPPIEHPREPVEWEGGEAGTDYLDYRYSTDGLYPARWAYVVSLTYYCDDGGVFSIEQPTFYFTIRD